MDNTIEKHTEYVTARVVKTNRGYGLFIISGDGKGKTYPNLTSDLALLCDFADKINEGEVSPLHVYDIIEDMLG